MDASALRWTLAIIGIVLLVGIYLHGLHQSRLRKRMAMETLTREEVDSAFIEDEELRTELDNLSQIITETDEHESYDDIHINPAIEADLTPFKLPPPEWFVADILTSVEPDQLINYLLYRVDYQLMSSEAVESALRLAGLVVNTAGYMEYRHEDELSFTMTSLSAPGHFVDIGIANGNAEFSTQGFNCFINLQDNSNPAASYEIMLKKIDELVRLLNVKVYQPNHDLLTISDVTRIRSKLLS
jgi:FtsZ-interacting cell division protein ZipA